MFLNIALLLSLTATWGVCQDVWPQDTASASQGPGRYNFTYEIAFDLIEFDSVIAYQFNISVGSPPQGVPVIVDLTTSDVRIDNTTSWALQNGSGTQVDFYRYNPNLSSSSYKDVEILSLDSSPNPPRLADDSFVNMGVVVYTADNYSIGRLDFSSQLLFISYSRISRGAASGARLLSNDYPEYWHSLGFGLSETVSRDVRERNNFSSFTGVIDDLRLRAGVIRSRTYSLWLDTPEQQSGHLLLGGLDAKAYVGPLTSLATTISTNQQSLYRTPMLTVNTSIVSVAHSQQSSSPLSLFIGRTVLTSRSGSVFPPMVAVEIWEALGADYKSSYNALPQMISPEGRLALTIARVPCSYLTNSSTLDFQFQGANLTIGVPMADITIPYSTYGYADVKWLCALRIRASMGEDVDGGISYLGADMLKQVYQVYDLDNKAISIALTDFGSTERNILPIPEKGGIAAMNVAPITFTPKSSSTHKLIPIPTSTPAGGASPAPSNPTSGTRKLADMGLLTLYVGLVAGLASFTLF